MSIFWNLESRMIRIATLDLRTLKSYPSMGKANKKQASCCRLIVRYQVPLKMGLWSRAEKKEYYCKFL